MIGLLVGVEGGGGVGLELDSIPCPSDEVEVENDEYQAGRLDESRGGELLELSRHEVDSSFPYCAGQ